MESLFLSNSTSTRFIDKLRQDLSTCNAFYFSVSFIKQAGLALIYSDIISALKRGAKGILITSTYQNFTDIESLRMFLELKEDYKNFDCHLDFNCMKDMDENPIGYHSKGYLFEFDETTEIIIGSSNITRYALLKNVEWDLVLRESKLNNRFSKTYSDAIGEFNNLWLQTKNLSDDLIQRYQNRLAYVIERWDMDYDFEKAKIKPNYMQREALKELKRFRIQGVDSALIIAAAGSGKTYLAAFDAFNFNPSKLLYIVHEGSILRKSIETFKHVFGNQTQMGEYTGQKKELNSDFLFATNVTMANNLFAFSKNAFDYIIIDEAHHVVAETYQKIINYFKPKFLLGLTATPERLDQADVAEVFKYNVPYELRLRDAIINGLVVPFKYYGIRDQIIDYGYTDPNDLRLLSEMVDENHIDKIREEVERYKPKTGKIKALVFCRNIQHCKSISEALSKYYNTDYLTGKNNSEERLRKYDELQDDNRPLEMLLTVDILNEGVDIPGVNMVLFLRPTESPTIFIQQLGRGLRKADNKEYVTVLDFIGNSYRRSIQIVLALSNLGERLVVEKNTLKQLVQNDFELLGLEKYGVEIKLDNLSKEEITDFIESENFNNIKYLSQDYYNFKKYIGCETYPLHEDYLNNTYAPEILNFMNAKSNGKKNYSYYNFLKSINEPEIPNFDENQVNLINFMSSFLPLVRPHEYIIFSCILSNNNSIRKIKETLKNEIENISEIEISHSLSIVSNDKTIVNKENGLYFNATINKDFKDYCIDLFSYGLGRYESEYLENEDFILWNSYRKDQVQLKLCHSPHDNMKGTYVYDGEVYMFVNLRKDLPEDDLKLYLDKFLSKNIFQWECEHHLSQKSKDKLIYSKKAHIFVRKMEKQFGQVFPFTYVGTGKMVNPREYDDFVRIKGLEVEVKHKDTIIFDIIMDHELPEYLQKDFNLIEK